MAGYWDTGLLIAAVRGHSLLWDPEQPGYKDKVRKGEAWISVCRALAPDYDNMNQVEQTVFEKAVHSRWRGVRDSYMKDCKKQSNKAKLGAMKPRRYLYSEQLSFLDKVMGNKTTADKPSLSKEEQEEEEAVQEVEKETSQNTSKIQTVTRRAANRTQEVGVRRNPSRNKTRGQTESHNAVTANISPLAKETEEDAEEGDGLPDITNSLHLLLDPGPTVNGATNTSFAKTEDEDVVQEIISHNDTTPELLSHSRPTLNETTDETQREKDDDVKVELVVKGESHRLKSKPSPPPRPRPTKRKIMSLEERMVKFMEESVRQEDEDKDFFMSMLPAVRNLNEEQKMDFRIQVIRSLQNIKAGRYGSYA